MTDQQIDEFLEMLSKSPTSARDMVRGLFAAHEAKAAPAVPRGDLLNRVVANRLRFEKWATDSNQGYDLTRENCGRMSSYLSSHTEHAWRGYCAAALAAPSQEPGKCAQCKKPYRKGANTEGCPKCAPGVVVPESEFQKPISAPSQPVNRPQNCGTSYCSCIECVCEPEPVTLTEEEIDNCLHRSNSYRHFAILVIAALREKEQAK